MGSQSGEGRSLRFALVKSGLPCAMATFQNVVSEKAALLPEPLFVTSHNAVSGP